MGSSKKAKNKVRKPRWRTLSPASRAAKVALRDERRAKEAAHIARKKEKAAAAAAATTESTATKDAHDAGNDGQAPRQQGPRGDEKKETARVDGMALAKDLPEASTGDAAVASTDAAMPDAPDFEAKIPGEEEDKAQPPQKPEAEAEAETTTPATTAGAAAASSGDSDNGGVRVRRSTRSRIKI